MLYFHRATAKSTSIVIVVIRKWYNSVSICNVIWIFLLCKISVCWSRPTSSLSHCFSSYQKTFLLIVKRQYLCVLFKPTKNKIFKKKKRFQFSLLFLLWFGYVSSIRFGTLTLGQWPHSRNTNLHTRCQCTKVNLTRSTTFR